MHPVFIYFKFSWFFTLLGPDDIILCTVDVAGLYPNITHDKGLSALCETRFKTGKRCHYLSTSRTCWGCS